MYIKGLEANGMDWKNITTTEVLEAPSSHFRFQFPKKSGTLEYLRLTMRKCAGKHASEFCVGA